MALADIKNGAKTQKVIKVLFFSGTLTWWLLELYFKCEVILFLTSHIINVWSCDLPNLVAVLQAARNSTPHLLYQQGELKS